MGFKTINEIIAAYNHGLNSIYPKEEIRNFVYLIMDHKLGFSKIDILMKGDQLIIDEIQDFCRQALENLKQNIPIQYILGETEFYNLAFKVNPSVLIPRPETEELVHWIIEDNQLQEPSILDIGTGSGCIPITLKKNILNAHVTAWDISLDALETAKSNAKLNNVPVNFQHQNVLDSNIDDSVYDIIVSNPPYVRELEKDMMDANVLANEPHLALFVSNTDPLLFYKAISSLAIKGLKNGGALYFEINEAFGKETCVLLQEAGFSSIELRTDLFGKDRMIKAVKFLCT